MVNEHSLNNGDYYQNGFTETSKLTTFAQVSDTILRHFGLNIHFLDKISIFNFPVNSYKILGTIFVKVFCNCSTTNGQWSQFWLKQKSPRKALARFDKIVSYLANSLIGHFLRSVFGPSFQYICRYFIWSVFDLLLRIAPWRHFDDSLSMKADLRYQKVTITQTIFILDGRRPR